MRFCIIIIGLCVGMFMMSCPTEDPAHKKDEDVQQKNKNLPQLKAEWELEYAAWKLLDIQNYQFVFELGDTGIHQKITVKDRVCESAIDIFHNELGVPYYETIDAIFDSINGHFFIEENFAYPSGQIGTSFSINYDPQYHYPVKYSVIYIYDHSNGYIAGNGVTIEITEFTILENE